MEQRECFRDDEELNLYLDGELSPDRMLRLKTHLLTCEKCSYRYEIALSLKLALKNSCGNVSAPSWLRERILNAIRKEKVVRPGLFRDSLNALFRGRPLVPVGIAAMLVIVLASALYYGRPKGENMPFIRELVHEHREYLEKNLNLGIESEDPLEISGWIMANTGMSVNLPPVSESFAPEGACALQHDDNTIGYVYFDNSRKRISLFILEDKYDGLFGQKTLKFGNISLFCGHCTGMNYVLWENNDVVCVLVGELPESSLVSLAKEFI